MDYLKIIGLNPALAWVKFIKDHFFTILMVVIVGAGITLFYFDYKETKAGLIQANTQIALYQKTIDEQKATIKDLQDKLALASKSNDITNAAEEKINQAEQAVEKDAIRRQHTVEKKVSSIKAKKDTSEQEKEKEVSSVYIDDLWVGHCKRPENAALDECRDFLPLNETDSLELKPASTITPTTTEGLQP